ncbi:Periplasmic nitrate reductase maturation protein NapF [Sulfurimonas denitrificans DSM 1251]|uniref:Periplasmic nitrate reductase maturation protein NapF n=1 Tax=Sulfurimonas denitrificans (strain ATCC 33889 / DSM 1251) TaxID=326298 RepID=Q30QD6_SULDN|nr:ferredoxin-type protein NapF [Sulfurimonas denitrificans]ABB44795.1 Periplasmic nitrate reductase maturation protein NapF [Sulfurimonas denitrificans DSM 1251]MDD3443379.1 ferredoxin-type protein NapF [Sulfurimonas denitrificans]
MQRRELFSSLASSLKGEKKQEKQLRPPYFGDESLFHNECNRCDGVCATVCEEDIIKIADDKTPYILFSYNGCTYCDKCTDVCEFGVLKLEDKKYLNAIITINRDKCLSWSHTMCFSCKDPCLDNAIDFKAMFMPEINNKCTSCGFCISRCPTDAIDIKVL